MINWTLAIIIIAAISIHRTSYEWFVFGLLLLGMIVVLNLNWLRSVLAGVALTFEHHIGGRRRRARG